MTLKSAARLLASLLIVTVLAGCDNVQWGGGEFAVLPPPPRAGGDDEEEEGPRAERVPDGPILYYIRVTDGQAVLRPIGEVAGDSLLPIRAAADWELFGSRFIGRHLRSGREFVLLRGGSRVGTFVLQDAGIPDENVCPRVPVGRGVVELTPAAAEVSEFLALAKPQDFRPGPPLVSPEPEPRHRRYAPILAEQLMRARNAPLPGNWQRAMAQLRLLPMLEGNHPAFASTFLVNDTLAIGRNNEGHSVFFIAQANPQGAYQVVYSHFTRYEEDGKAAPRIVDFLDWNHNGQPEVLLEVFSTDERWFEAVGRSEDGWRQILNDRCPRPAPAAPTQQPPADQEDPGADF